jgi:hypothetical protein
MRKFQTFKLIMNLSKLNKNSTDDIHIHVTENAAPATVINRVPNVLAEITTDKKPLEKKCRKSMKEKIQKTRTQEKWGSRYKIIFYVVSLSVVTTKFIFNVFFFL